ncbi:hypothetical protein CR513_06747, partial [Mucuna pruriens]
MRRFGWRILHATHSYKDDPPFCKFSPCLMPYFIRFLSHTSSPLSIYLTHFSPLPSTSVLSSNSHKISWRGGKMLNSIDCHAMLCSTDIKS